ncbi:MAG TPA: SDR family NAD(P)-dependent oxidoreductase [Verrucomicrobiae bacterium]|nr:SDR family NAD(P)-dependent oxidoreductase [Verrucomicrobiae bacterium]
MNLLDLSGKSAFVTGAGQGVGRQIALHLAAHGARVGVNDVNAERAQSVVDEIVAQGGAGLALAGDVTDFKSVSAAAETLGGAELARRRIPRRVERARIARGEPNLAR